MKLFKEKITRTIIDIKSGQIVHERVEREPSVLGIALGVLIPIIWAGFKIWFGV